MTDIIASAIQVIGLGVFMAFGGLVTWLYISLRGDIRELREDFRREQDMQREFRDDIDDKFDQGFREHGDIRERVAHVEALTNGKGS